MKKEGKGREASCGVAEKVSGEALTPATGFGSGKRIVVPGVGGRGSGGGVVAIVCVSLSLPLSPISLPSCWPVFTLQGIGEGEELGRSPALVGRTPSKGKESALQKPRAGGERGEAVPWGEGES